MTTCSKLDEQQQREPAEHDSRIDAFFNGSLLSPDDVENFDTGYVPQISNHKANEIERAMAALIETGDIPNGLIIANFCTTIDSADEALCEKIYNAPTYVSPYDKCFTLVRTLETQLEVANADNIPKIKADLKEANAAWGIEKDRALDDRYRKFQLINRWRATEGCDDYNAARRTKRSEPNASLGDMTEGERKAHRLAQKADSAWRAAKVKDKWTEEQIEEGKKKRKAKRIAHTA